MRLRILRPAAGRLVTPELAAGDQRWAESAWLPFVDDMDRAISLEAFDAAVDQALKTTARFDASLDAWLAPRLHRALPLTRREAADAGVWRYLAVVHRPDLVRHRWENRTWSTTRSRFWSLGTRHTSNAIARVWWIAELTREGASYALTDQVLSRPSLATQVFVRGWSVYRPAVAAFTAAMADAPAETIERAARELTRYLAMVPLETQGAPELRAAIERLASAR